MKKVLPFLFLTLVLILPGLSFAEDGSDEADGTLELIVQEKDAKLSSGELGATDQGTPQPAKSTCPARQGFVSQSETELLVQNAAMTPETQSLLPKICVVDCTPCNTKADCEAGPCKAIQCP